MVRSLTASLSCSVLQAASDRIFETLETDFSVTQIRNVGCPFGADMNQEGVRSLGRTL
jgi:hypothetical protein